MSEEAPPRRATGVDLALLIDNLPEVVARIRPDGTWHYLSGAASRLLGHEPEELVGTQALEIVDPIDRAEANERLARIADTEGAEERMTVRLRPGEGMSVWIDVTGRTVRDPATGELFIASVSREAVAAEETAAPLGRAEERFRALVEWLPAVVYEAETGPSGEFRYVSPQIEDLLGYSPAEWLADPRRWYEALHPDQREVVVELERHQAEESRQTGGRLSSEYRMVRRDGRPIWVRDIARLREEDGKPAYWRGVLIDITAERQAQEQLAEASARYRDVIDALPACVYRSVVGVRGRWLFVSPQIERLLGYTPEEWMADPKLWQASLHPDDRERVELQEETLIDAAAGTEIVTEYRLRHRRGDVVWVRDRAIVTVDPNGDRIIDGFITEISAERAAAAGSERADVFRLACIRCEKTWAAERPERCPDCESAEVEAVSLNATLADLAAARQQVEGLLDGVHKHLEALETNLHSVSTQSGARPDAAGGE